MTDLANLPIIDAILQEEGWPRFTDTPGDHGGPTKGGITLGLLQSLRPGATLEDLKALTEDDARGIYEAEFITRPGFYKIVDGLLRWQVVDCGVPSGPHRATEWLRQAVGVEADGQLGPKTIAAVNAADPHRVAIRLACIRIRFFGQDVHNDPSQAKWLNGWLARATGFLEREAQRKV